MLIIHPVNCYLPVFLLECLQAHHVFHWKKAWMTQTQTQPSFSHGIQCFHFIFKINDLYPPRSLAAMLPPEKLPTFPPISEAGSSSFPTIFQGRAAKRREGNQSKIDSNDSTLHGWMFGEGLCFLLLFFLRGGWSFFWKPGYMKKIHVQACHTYGKTKISMLFWLKKLTWVRVQGQAGPGSYHPGTKVFFFSKNNRGPSRTKAGTYRWTFKSCMPQTNRKTIKSQNDQQDDREKETNSFREFMYTGILPLQLSTNFMFLADRQTSLRWVSSCLQNHQGLLIVGNLVLNTNEAASCGEPEPFSIPTVSVKENCWPYLKHQNM